MISQVKMDSLKRLHKKYCVKFPKVHQHRANLSVSLFLSPTHSSMNHLRYVLNGNKAHTMNILSQLIMERENKDNNINATVIKSFRYFPLYLTPVSSTYATDICSYLHIIYSSKDEKLFYAQFLPASLFFLSLYLLYYYFFIHS